MAAYIDRAFLESLGFLQAGDLARLEDITPGIVATTIEVMSGYADSRLRKRYVVPLQEPVPAPIKLCIASLVTASLYARRGIVAGSEQDTAVTAAKNEALDFLKELANERDALAELPLREDLPTEDGVSRGGPLCEGSVGPYAYLDEGTNGW